MPVSFRVNIESFKSYLRRYDTVVRAWRRLKNWKANNAGTNLPSCWTMENLRFIVTESEKKTLNEFLDSRCEFILQKPESPLLSVIIPVFNRAELTFACLRSLAQVSNISTEIIVIDNSSTDQTKVLCSRIKGLRYVLNEKRLHYLESSNQGAQLAKGQYLLILNNDTQVLPGALEAALSCFSEIEDVGAVGAKLIRPDGSLQEAGSLVWSNGICAGYGRDDDPAGAPYQFRREVDYCSGAFLLTPRKLFLEMGMFDLDFRPAYYEEADYCLRLNERGLKVIYDPSVVVKHFEFASASCTEEALKLQHERREILVRKHRDLLGKRPEPSPESVLNLRMCSQPKGRILFLDERVSHFYYGAGYPRANAMIRSLVKLGYFVTLYPVVYVEPGENWGNIYNDLPREVEVMAGPGWGPGQLLKFLKQRKGYYDALIVSRPETMRELRRILANNPDLVDLSRTIYDAEAVFSCRDRLEAQVQGRSFSEEKFRESLKKELSLVEGVRAVAAVSPGEARYFEENGFRGTGVISHAVKAAGAKKPFQERSGILFVGSMFGNGGPNYDSMHWFCREALPLLRSKGIADTVWIVGHNESSGLKEFEDLGVKVTGAVEDLREWYERVKVFIAPTRFSAGIPLKVVEASANGLPSVISPLLSRQLGWENELGLVLVADGALAFAEAVERLLSDEVLWSATSQKVLQQTKENFSEDAMAKALNGLLGGVLG